MDDGLAAWQTGAAGLEIRCVRTPVSTSLPVVARAALSSPVIGRGG
eukprot:CAMPEP_0119532754 /NCGR_PEP_ID=MMETSP1344-20130328/46220_1 /TAXON_ID=236787 /ORGANISM="Florenciella parvula, Strain CCMP2471" /LENGTH=45 /DNA_ID= /DNA_START= /DNA_END= /DNA_ORIENTATION=